MSTAIESLTKLFGTVKIKANESDFVYCIDTDNIWPEFEENIFGNLTPDYSTFLNNGLMTQTFTSPCNRFENDRNVIVGALIGFINRIAESCKNMNAEQYNWFLRMSEYPADSFREAIQRILFVNMVLWQTNHRLIGLGRWDVLLENFYRKDVEKGTLKSDDTLAVFCDVLKLLHKDYQFKSNMLLGDTGQVIVLGGSTQTGEYIYNDLTEIIIEAVNKVSQPDPKLMLRVNKNTPRRIFDCALTCISTGCGSPLISNDDAIISKLIEFGIKIDDAINYGVSACWEPLISGKDTSLNNVTTLNFLRGLNNLLQRDNLDKIKSFDEFINRYLLFLSRNINAVKRVVSLQRFQYDPVLSLFMCGCYENRCDVAHGGANYHDIGITSVALANTVNALLNIKEFVFGTGEFTLQEVKQLVAANFVGYESLLVRLRERENAFGSDNSESINLTNEIVRFVSKKTIDFRNYLGGRLKFGLSAPSYINSAKGFPASFDGRLKDEPYTVHISNEKVSSQTAIILFAGALDYGENRFNGNVVDLITTPSFICNNKKKVVDFLMLSVKIKFFQLQMNVISSDVLITAKKNPTCFPNLIVRVWGFSAYMADLPEEYQDVLITRALENEKRK